MFKYFFAGGGRIKKTQKSKTTQPKQTKQLLPPLKKGALIKHPNKGGTKSNFQKWKNLFNTRKSIINLK